MSTKLEKEMEYGKKAMAYCQTHPQEVRPTINPGSQEWEAWRKYFVDFLGFEPRAMRAVRTERIQMMTVPAQWPEWFDLEYAARRAA